MMSKKEKCLVQGCTEAGKMQPCSTFRNITTESGGTFRACYSCRHHNSNNMDIGAAQSPGTNDGDVDKLGGAAVTPTCTFAGMLIATTSSVGELHSP